MKQLSLRFKELTTFYKIFSVIYSLGLIGGIFRICVSPMGSVDHAVLLAGYHMPGAWGTLVRIVYVLLLGLFLYGLFLKLEIGYYSIQIYHTILILNGIASTILYFFRLEYFFIHYSEKLLKMVGYESFLSPKILMAANIGTFMGLAGLGFILLLAFRKRRMAFTKS